MTRWLPARCITLYALLTLALLAPAHSAMPQDDITRCLDTINNSPDRQQRVDAMRALVKGEALLPLAGVLQHHPDAVTRADVVRILDNQLTAETVPILLHAIRTDADGTVRKEAISSLRYLPYHLDMTNQVVDLIDLLVDHAQHDPDPQTARVALAVLDISDDATMLPVCQACLDTPEHPARITAFAHLPQSADPHYVGTLLRQPWPLELSSVWAMKVGSYPDAQCADWLYDVIQHPEQYTPTNFWDWRIEDYRNKQYIHREVSSKSISREEVADPVAYLRLRAIVALGMQKDQRALPLLLQLFEKEPANFDILHLTFPSIQSVGLSHDYLEALLADQQRLKDPIRREFYYLFLARTPFPDIRERFAAVAQDEETYTADERAEMLDALNDPLTTAQRDAKKIAALLQAEQSYQAHNFGTHQVDSLLEWGEPHILGALMAELQGHSAADYLRPVGLRKGAQIDSRMMVANLLMALHNRRIRFSLHNIANFNAAQTHNPQALVDCRRWLYADAGSMDVADPAVAVQVTKPLYLAINAATTPFEARGQALPPEQPLPYRYPLGSIVERQVTITNTSDRAIIITDVRNVSQQGEEPIVFSKALPGKLEPVPNSPTMRWTTTGSQVGSIGLLLPGQWVQVRLPLRVLGKQEDFTVRYLQADQPYDGTAASLQPYSALIAQADLVRDWGRIPPVYQPFTDAAWRADYNIDAQFPVAWHALDPRVAFLTGPARTPEEKTVTIETCIDGNGVTTMVTPFLERVRLRTAAICGLPSEQIALAYSTALGGYVVVEPKGQPWLFTRVLQRERGPRLPVFPLLLLKDIDCGPVTLTVEGPATGEKLWGKYPLTRTATGRTLTLTDKTLAAVLADQLRYKATLTLTTDAAGTRHYTLTVPK